MHDSGKGLKNAGICDDPDDNPSKSIGISNIRQRLLNFYGPTAELNLICNEGEGTIARIFIPAAGASL